MKEISRTSLKLILVLIVVISIIGRIWAGGWLVLLFWWVIIIPSIWHFIIHAKYLWNIKEIRGNHLEIIYISHVVYIILFLFQPDIGDGAKYSMVFIDLIDLVFKGFSDYVNTYVEIEFWEKLLIPIGIIYVITEFVTMKQLKRFRIQEKQ